MTLVTTKPEILFVAAWWPDSDHPFDGLFIKEQARAISAQVNLHIVHLTIKKDWGFFIPQVKVVNEKTEIGDVWRIHISTLIRRFGLHDYLVKLAYNRVIQKIRAAHKIQGLNLNVRTHLTRFVPFLNSTRDLPFVHTEHFSYYHRGILLKPEKERIADTALIKSWMKDGRLKSIMPVSNELAQTLIQKFDAPLDKVNVIPNIANEVFQYAPLSKSNKLKIVCAATWQGPKKPLLLFEALCRLSKEQQQRIHLIVVGEGEYFPSMKEFFDQNDKHFEVEITGFLNKAHIAQHMQEAAFFVHPTSSENAPTVISEALCCGAPVLSMAVNGILEMVDESNGHLVKPDNLETLVNGLTWMIDNHNNFDREKIAKEACTLYSPEVIGEKIFHEISKMF